MHPELLKLTVQACRDYMEAGDCHGEAPPSERLIAAVVQLREELDAANEQAAQLARALRPEVEPPTFMGEPVLGGADDEAYRQFQRDRIAEAQRHDAEQAKPSLRNAGVLASDANTVPHHTPMVGKDEQ